MKRCFPQSKVLVKTSGDFCITEFPHPGEITLRRVAETEIKRQNNDNNQNFIS